MFLIYAGGPIEKGNEGRKDETSLSSEEIQTPQTQNQTPVHPPPAPLLNSQTPQTQNVNTLFNGVSMPQGLPNLGNQCYQLSGAHTMSRLLPKDELRPYLTELLHITSNFLEGKNQTRTPEEISNLLWKYSIEAWPEYGRKTETGRNIQYDAAEYFMRIADMLEEENHKTTKHFTSKINTTRRCVNDSCTREITTRIDEEQILRTTEIPNNTKISLQAIVDNFIPQITTERYGMCDKCAEVLEVTSTLLTPTPIIIIHINKAKGRGTETLKTETEIQINEEIKITTTENPLGESYKVSDVISHHGTQATNGHYITTHCMNDQEIWQKIDDEKSTQISRKEADKLNEQGVIYVLRRNNETQSSKDDHGNKVTIKSSKHSVPAGRDVTYKHIATKTAIPNNTSSRPITSINARRREPIVTPVNSNPVRSQQPTHDRKSANHYSVSYAEICHTNSSPVTSQQPTHERKSTNHYSVSYAENYHTDMFQQDKDVQGQRTQIYNESERDVRMRMNNVIIQSLIECGEEADIQEVININKAIGNVHFTKYNIMKLGRIGDKVGDHPRPLKVELDSHTSKLNMMRNANQLQFSPHYYNLSIQHDLTRKQNEIFRGIKEESKRIEKEDKSGQFKYRVRGPPGKWRIIRFPKN